MRAKIVNFFQIYYYFGVKRGIPAAASKKSRQWLRASELSLVNYWALLAALFLAVLRNDLDNSLASHCIFERNASCLPLIGIAVILRRNGVQKLFGMFAQFAFADVI